MISGILLRLEHILGKQSTLKTIKNKFKSDTEAAGWLYCVAYGDITEYHATEGRGRGYLLLLPEHEGHSAVSVGGVTVDTGAPQGRRSRASGTGTVSVSGRRVACGLLGAPAYLSSLRCYVE